MTAEQRLAELGYDLPPAASAAGNYLPFVRTGSLLMISGQLPFRDGRLLATGLLGRELTTRQGQEAARQCALNLLAQARAGAGDLENIVRLVKITVFVASTPDFIEQHLVADGASDLLAEVLAERGRHARAAVGTAVLPLNAPVEIEAMVELG
ncbi:MAG: RidA family protein [Nitratireductor sp.]